jgi:RNA 2',3'-cyclic 3'-phosphodiesterase
MSRIRTFIAIDVDKAICARLVALQETLGQAGSEIKWVEPENLHVTLLFLGEVDDRDLAGVCSAVAECCKEHSPFRMSIEGADCFGNRRRPRTLWVGVGQGAQEICALHDDLEPPLLQLGCYRREKRKYTPHLTLGRVRSDRPNDQLASALTQQSKWKGGEMSVSEVLVMSSELASAGPTYTVMSRAKLAGEH